MQDRPWMTALEMQFAALRGAHQIKSAPIPKSDLINNDLAIEILRSATPFAWSSDCISAVSKASETIPDDARLSLELLPAPYGWWWFGEPLPGTRVGGIGPTKSIVAECRGIAWGPAKSGHVHFLGFDYVSDDIRFPVADFHFSWLAGTTIRDYLDRLGPAVGRQLTDEEIHQGRIVASAVAKFALAAMTWLNQRVIVLSSGRIERHRRKQLLREHDVSLSEVQVIQLRRAESQPKYGDTDAEQVEWSCRWIVNGHWRNQYHPSTGKHELKYILPYVKGPDGKPLKVPTQTVYSVNR